MGLFEEICSYQNLLSAFDKFEQNAGVQGVDNITIAEFSVNLQTNLSVLSRSLLDGTYRPDALRKVGIPKDNGKTRWLCIPTVRDRVAHTSVANALTPLLDPEFEDCSYAYRKERSVKKAIQKIIELRDKGYVWVVDADITAFFDEVDHDILIAAVAKYVKDPRTVKLISQWLKADIFYRGDKTRLTKGIPQGSPLSPLLANLYLDEFDEALMDEKYRHVRFSDDFVILCKDAPHAEDALELTGEVLKKLHLSLNAEKTRIVHFNQGFKFLGMEFLRSLVYRPMSQEEHDDTDAGWALPSQVSDQAIPEEIDQPTDVSVPADTGEGVNAQPDIPSAQPDTIMAEAFKKARSTTAAESVDSLFHEKPEIEPSAFGEPFLRTLYLMEQGVTLAKEDERFKIVKDKVVVKEIPVIKIDQIIVFGNIQLTTQAMKFCLEENIPVILLSSSGKYFGCVESFKRTSATLHRKQFGIADNEALSLPVARAIVKGKISNAQTLMMRYGRNRQDLPRFRDRGGTDAILESVDSVRDTEELLGLEGAASAHHFSLMRLLVGEQWGFERRRRQPPPDPVNSLLSYGYTLLFYNVYSMVRLHGLHPYVGFLHEIRDGHPALVSDIVEEFRAPVVDALVLNLIIRGSLKPEDFLLPEGEGMPCLLQGDARKVFIKAFESKMNSPIIHEKTGYHVDYRRCIDLQVQEIKKVIEGQCDRYVPFSIR